ncbi:hypothetical protein Cflav_PD0063 [Pedosphaera parvula Ellin514]|uniref:Uncharacterized protein n=1 Tax=Pedosphaera parvula (strain Ellin514) TaxID=320771 RepID=B9XSY2_PEDPL|nr:hypothetical protein Cflav_PD0063 [Pedosphaera parvula Ellin514]
MNDLVPTLNILQTTYRFPPATVLSIPGFQNSVLSENSLVPISLSAESETFSNFS